MNRTEKLVLFYITVLLAITAVVTGIMTVATGLDPIYRDISGGSFILCLISLLYEMISIEVEIK